MSPLSGVLTETWALYRRYAAHFLLIAFVIYLVAAVLVALLSLAGLFGYFLGEIIELTAVFLLQAALVKAVQDVRDGRVDLSFSQTVRAALPYLLPVAAAGAPTPWTSESTSRTWPPAACMRASASPTGREKTAP